MPGGSLPGVSQQFGADASGYLSEVGKVIAANRELVASAGEVKRALGEVAALRGGAGGGSPGSGAALADEFRRQMEAARAYAQAAGEAEAATGALTAAQQADMAAVRSYGGVIADLADRQRALAAVTGAGTDAVAAHAEQVRGAAGAAGDLAAAQAEAGASARAWAADVAEGTRVLRESSAAAGVLSEAMGPSGGGGGGAYLAGSLGAVRDTAREATAAVTETAAAIGAVHAAAAAATVQVETRSVYGRESYYPANDAAKLFREIAGMKQQIPGWVLQLVGQLGYSVEGAAGFTGGAGVRSPGVVQVQTRTVYDKDLAYPANEAAEIFARLSATKTLTESTMKLIGDLGYTIEDLAPAASASSGGVASYGDSLGAVRDTAREATAAVADTAAAIGAVHAAAATTAAAGPGGSLTDIGRQLDQIGLGAGYASYRDLFRASLGAGGGAALAVRSFYGTGPMSPPSGTGGGFAGGLWPAAPSGGGGGGGGLLTAAGYADAITNWAGRVAPAVHYVTMAIAELAATVVPAAVALGAAGFVGLQGGQQMATRIAAINTVEQSLGGAYGQTTGTFLGLQPKLQALQNYAQGGTYEIAGAGINLLKSGFGGAFGGEGVQTIAMIDRGIADMQSNIAAKGTGAELGSLLGQGPNYLRQFGDIGSNIGNAILNIAPHLPGVGEDWLASLEGITGGIAWGTGLLDTHHMGDVIGGLMAGEAGWRLGTPLLGLAGKGLTGLGGLAAKAGLGALPLGEDEIAALAASTGIDAGLIDAGGSGLAGGLGAAGAGLGALTGPAVAGLAVSAFLGSKLISSMPSPAQRQVSGMQAQIGREGYTAALGMQAPAGFQAQGWLPLGKAITETTGLAGAVSPYASMSTLMGTSQTAEEYGRFGPQGETTRQVYQNAASGFEKQMADLTASGPQLVKILDGLGLKGTSMGAAFQIAQNSLLDLSHAFGANGKLSKQATTMIGDYVSALEPMTQNAGALGAAIGAQTIMSQGSVKHLQEVNQSMDSMTSIMTGGASGVSGFQAQIAGVRAGYTTPSGKADTLAESNAAMAKALTSFTSPGGQSAWAAFASASTTAPGLITSMEQNLDQYRTALTLGAIGPGGGAGLGVAAGMGTVPGGAAGLAGYQLQQLLPMARQSPAALAMVMQQGAQMGITGYYNQSESLKQNYQQAAAAIGKVADGTRTANAATAVMTENLSKIPTIAKEFSTTVGTTLQSQEAAKAATDLIGIQNAAMKGGIDTGALKDWVSTLKGAGVEGGQAITQTMDAQLRAMGVSREMTIKINAVVGKITLPKFDGGTVQYHSKVDTPAVPPPPRGGVVEYTTRVPRPVAPPAPMGGTVVYHSVVEGIQGVVGIPAGVRAQHGMLVPGAGGGDRYPALLEGGEAVVPRHLVPAVAPFLSAHRVPGFQAGGFAGAEGFGSAALTYNTMFAAMEASLEGMLGTFESGLSQALDGALGSSRGPFGGGMFQLGRGTAGAAPAGTPQSPVAVELVSGAIGGGGAGAAALGALPIPAAAQKVIDAFEKTFKGMGNPWGGFASQIMQGLLDSVKDASKETSAEAKALTAKVTTEVNYARNVASAAAQGQGYGTAGLLGTFGNLATPAMTAQGQPYQYYADQQNAAAGGTLCVQQQMSDYLQAEKSFTADLGKLSKGGLNKSLQQQLLAAGPLQGDQMAQSILGGAGEAGGANKLWSQIGKASNALGIGGAEGVYGYGGVGASKSVKVGVHTDAAAAQSAIDAIHGKSVVISVKLDMSGGGGAGAGVSLTAAQVKQVVEQVQASLLQQAKRNRKTGLTLPGYGS